jgi:hypothetical protein
MGPPFVLSIGFARFKVCKHRNRGHQMNLDLKKIWLVFVFGTSSLMGSLSEPINVYSPDVNDDAYYTIYRGYIERNLQSFKTIILTNVCHCWIHREGKTNSIEVFLPRSDFPLRVKLFVENQVLYVEGLSDSINVDLVIPESLENVNIYYDSKLQAFNGVAVIRNIRF